VYVLDDQNPFETPLATLVASEAARAGIKLAGRDSLTVPAEAAEPSFAGEVEKILAAHPAAVFLAGGGNAGAAALWRKLHSADPHLLLLGCSSMANESFTSMIGPAAAEQTYITTPVLDQASYPAAARRVLRGYRSSFGRPGGPWVLYGYEAMSVVLDAIRRAGSHGNNRPDVIKSFMATRGRDSVIGRYSLRPDGETTLAKYAVDRVARGRPVFLRTIDTASAPPASGG
jgi:branched-chain amino acid transport system substrate-binding protein